MVTYCKMHGDHSIKEWEDAEQWQRDDTVKMVKAVLSGEHSPRKEHDRWQAGKIAKGYVYGAVKNDNPDNGPLTNPNIGDYDKLPIIQRMMGSLLFVVTVGMAAHYDLAVSKVPEFA